MKIISTFFLLFIAITSFAQKKQNIYLLDDNGKIVTSKDSVTYVRVIEEPDSGSTDYNLTEYNRDNSRKRLGKVSSFSPNLIFEGPLIEFYKNGKRKQIENYVDNSLVGSAYYYYPNGKIREERNYPDIFSDALAGKKTGKSNNTKISDFQLIKDRFLPKNEPDKPSRDDYKVIQYSDSNGNAFLDANSTGRIEVGSESTDRVTGNYIYGLKDGDWKEYIIKDSITYLETFSKGKLVTGKRIGANGSLQTYDRLEILPTFKGGMNNFYKFLATKIVYPSKALASNAGGKVFLKFVVMKDGRLNDIEVIYGAGYGLDEEAVRVLSLSPKWIPGERRGAAIPIKYKVAVNFSLSQ